MLTASLQILVAGLFVLFAGLCLGVGRASTLSAPLRRLAWRTTGWAFTIHGGSMLVQTVFAMAAFRAGPSSPVFDAYLATATQMNHSRTMSLVVFFAMLAALVWQRGGGTWVARHGVLAMVGGLALGAAAGGWDGPVGGRSHYSAVVSVDTLELVFVLSVLFLLLVRDAVDRLLWVCLASYGLMVAMNVLFISPVGLRDLLGLWGPPPWTIQAHRAVLVTVMIGLAVRRLQLARRGIDVPALFEPLGPAKPPPPLLE